MGSPDYIVDIAGLSEGVPAREGEKHTGLRRPWIAVRWRCCSTYSRIYRNAAGTLYEGRCPRCGKAVRARVGDGGTEARFFEAS